MCVYVFIKQNSWMQVNRNDAARWQLRHAAGEQAQRFKPPTRAKPGFCGAAEREIGCNTAQITHLSSLYSPPPHVTTAYCSVLPFGTFGQNTGTTLTFTTWLCSVSVCAASQACLTWQNGLIEMPVERAKPQNWESNRDINSFASFARSVPVKHGTMQLSSVGRCFQGLGSNPCVGGQSRHESCTTSSVKIR